MHSPNSAQNGLTFVVAHGTPQLHRLQKARQHLISARPMPAAEAIRRGWMPAGLTNFTKVFTQRDLTAYAVREATVKSLNSLNR